jgi:RNA polymerase sigma-70 factor, ECF subfamily
VLQLVPRPSQPPAEAAASAIDTDGAADKPGSAEQALGTDSTGGVDDSGELADARLVAGVLGGDRDAFEALYRRHASFAINLAVRLQGNRSDVEDLVHDAFLKAHQRMAELRDPAAFRPWLGSILVSLLRTRIRRARWFRGLGLNTFFGSTNQSRELVDVDSLASNSAGPDVRAEIAQVYALLRLLPADDRIAWTLRSVERHRLESVAEMTQCSLATAKRRIQRAQRFLDEHFVDAEGAGHSGLTESPATKAGDEQPLVDDSAPRSARLPRRPARRTS